jgi:hypothetical protein
MDLHVALIQDDSVAVFDQIREASARRRACTTDYEGGYELKRTWLPVSGHPFGTDAIVWQEIREWVGTPQTVVVVVIRDGDVFSGIAYWSGRLSLTTPYPVSGDVLGVDVAEELAPIVDAARRKLEAVQPQLN